MSHRIGVDIGPRRVRAVALSRGGGHEAVEVDWDGAAIADAIGALRERLGPGRAVAVAVDPEWLFAKRVVLPPVAPEQRANILVLEPERFFPVRGEALVVATRPDDDLVFAARRDQIEGWIAAVERLGPVERVEPGPEALARMLEASKVSNAAVLVMGTAGRGAVVRIADGKVTVARRMLGTPADLAGAVPPADGEPEPLFLAPWSDEDADAIRDRAPQTDVRPLPPPTGLAPDFACAYGAVLGLGEADGGGLAPPGLARRLARRRLGRKVLAVAGLAAACVFALYSLDASRNRAAARVDAELDRLRDATADIVALQAEGARLDAEVRALDAIAARRPNALDVLLEVSRLLPPEAYLRGIGGGEGSEWELDGYARNAAGLIPVLESSPAFADVRFRTATMRVRVGNEDYESFAITLRHVPAP